MGHPLETLLDADVEVDESDFVVGTVLQAAVSLQAAVAQEAWILPEILIEQGAHLDNENDTKTVSVHPQIVIDTRFRQTYAS